MNHFLKRFLQLFFAIVFSGVISVLITSIFDLGPETERNVVSFIAPMPIYFFLFLIARDMFKRYRQN